MRGFETDEWIGAFGSIECGCYAEEQSWLARKQDDR
jgi:hypothetical protein